MLLRKNGYIDYYYYYFSDQLLPILKGGNINNDFFPKKQNLSNF